MRNRIGIKIGERWVDIPEDVEVKYRWVNNIFHEETSQRDRSLAFTVPFSSKNNVTFNWLYDIGAPNDATADYIAQVFVGGIFLFHASIRVNETDDGYRIYLLGKFGSLSDLIGDDLLTDLDWTVTWPSLDETDVANGSYPDYPAWNPAGFYFRAEDVELEQFRGLHNYLYTPFASVARGEPRHAPYLLEIFDAIADHYGIPNVDVDKFATDPELSNLILLSVGRCTELSASRPDGFVPEMRISEFLRSLEIMFCCQFSIDNTSQTFKAEFLKDAALNTDMVDWTSKLSSRIKRVWENNVQGLTLDWSNQYRDTYSRTDVEFSTILEYFELENYPPGEWTVNLNAVLPIFGGNQVIFSPNDDEWFPTEYYGHIRNEEDIELFNHQGDFDTFNDLPTPSTLADYTTAYVRSEHRFYEVIPNNISKQWVYVSTSVRPLNTGDKKTKFTSNLAPAFMDVVSEFILQYVLGSEVNVQFPTHSILLNDWWRLPCIKGAEFSSKFSAPQLAFKRGIKYSRQLDIPRTGVITSTNHQYTYASSDEFDVDGTDAFNYSLHWDGDKGLFNTWWKDWAEILIGAQEIEADFNLTMLDIANLDFSKPVYVKGAKCYIKEIDLRMPLKGATRVKLLKTPR